MTVTYDPARVHIIVSGVPLGGYGDGTFCTIEEMSAGVVSKIGLDGEIARSVSIDKRAEIKFTLLQTSLSNLALGTLYDADQYSAGGFPFPLIIESLIGATLYASSQAWIRKRAANVFSRDVGMREWTIEAVTLTPQTIVSALQ